MKSAENTQKNGRLRLSFNTEKLNVVLIKCFYIFFGFLFSRINLMGKMAPFGFAFVSALSPVDSLFALIGSIFGYVGFLNEAMYSRYIAASIVVLVIKWAFNPFFENGKSFYMPILALFINLSLGLLYVYSAGATVYDLLIVLSESVLVSGSVYFIKNLYTATKNKESLKTERTVAALLFFTSLTILSLSEVTVGFVSIGHTLAAILILLLSLNSGALVSAAAGLCMGAVLSIGQNDGGFMVMCLGLGALLSGLFYKMGKIAVSLIFILCSVLSITIVGTDRENLYVLYEVLTASIIFLMVPERFSESLVFNFLSLEFTGEDYPNKYLSQRLRFVAESINKTKDSLCEVSELINKNTGGEVGKVFSKAADSVCRRCPLKISCWTEKYGDTMDAFNNLIAPLKQNGRVNPENVPDYLRQSCRKLNPLVNEINRSYTEFISEKNLNARSRQIRDIISGQFDGMSNLLYEMSQELSLTVCDKSAEMKVKNALLSLCLKPLDISFSRDKFGRKTAEFYLEGESLNPEIQKEICTAVSKATKTEFEEPKVINGDNMIRVVLCEKTPFKIEYAFYQMAAEGEEVCGDSFEVFSKEGGYSAAILSDGMGRGKRASLDSKMTLSLVKRFLMLGFSLENCMSLINSALMVKSEDESISTLDACIFDLHTGKAEFKKAGAAPSFVKRGKRVLKIEIDALPLGILNESTLKSAELKLSKGDIVLMSSDGMSSLFDSEIEKLLIKHQNGNLNVLCRELYDKARQKEDKNSLDDITIIALKLL